MKNKLKSVLLFCSLSSCCVHAGMFTPSIDLLYWHASQETSSFWSSVITVPTANEIVYSPPNNQFGWDTGVRLGLSYEPGKHYWDTSLVWTHFSSAKDNYLKLSAQIVAPEFFSGFLSRDLFFGADVDWQLSMHTVDLKASHAVPITQKFTIKPSIGLKVASIHQDIEAVWDALIYASNEKLKHHFHGVGPRFGLETQWNIHSHLSFVADFAAAFMWGKWTIEDTYSRPRALFGLIAPTTITTSMNEPKLGTLMLEYFLGLQWQSHTQHNITLQLGFESQFWANQLRVTTFQILPLHGDLTLQGGTCRFQIDL